MKRILTYFSMCIVAMAAMAQNKADIEVSYDWTTYNRDGVQITRPMTLLASAEFSKFYNKPGEYVDSLRSTPSGLKQYQDMAVAYLTAGKFSSLPKKTIYLYVVKNIADSILTVYDGVEEIGDYKFRYEEPLEVQSWKIIPDSTVMVLGYECVEATANWRGRDWKVWFTPEIPLDNGPWKLCGLPGLILKAEDMSGQHRFVATGIINSNKAIVPFPGTYDYEKINRKEMMKILRRFDEDPIGVSNAVDDGAFAGYHSKPISPLCDFLETDYK